jgi:adenosine deaminase
MTCIHPDRLGHGVPLFDDPALIEVVKERQIHVELCPTSNVTLGSVAGIEQHPIGRARALGLSVSVNSDIPGPLGCSLTSEHALLARVFDFTVDDFTWLRTEALAARFQPALRGPARRYAANSGAG